MVKERTINHHLSVCVCGGDFGSALEYASVCRLGRVASLEVRGERRISTENPPKRLFAKKPTQFRSLRKVGEPLDDRLRDKPLSSQIFGGIASRTHEPPIPKTRSCHCVCSRLRLSPLIGFQNYELYLQ
ncbi:hypothetical protein AVEN_132867-1 [Araneus ventricosus]|uniref:Uncharacterized protein n=1 Tax=Araneus ventricosus TaxID=182803 RepID=A0A4Y2GUA8_ARAVE|nr:hypothetical protein AVEN_132867-1 [Araneus ventricosus]